MALNIGESSAVATLLHALGVGIGGHPPRALREGQLLAALGVLTASAGKTLRLGWDPDDLRALDARLSPPPPANPLGKAGPRFREGLPTIDAVDEQQHPHWPPVRIRADRAPLCTHERTEYRRTRCSDETCGRCWLGGPANWPSLQPQA